MTQQSNQPTLRQYLSILPWIITAPKICYHTGFPMTFLDRILRILLQQLKSRWPNCRDLRLKKNRINNCRLWNHPLCSCLIHASIGWCFPGRTSWSQNRKIASGSPSSRLEDRIVNITSRLAHAFGKLAEPLQSFHRELCADKFNTCCIYGKILNIRGRKLL